MYRTSMSKIKHRDERDWFRLAAKAWGERVTASRETALSELVKLGICKKDGGLTKQYEG